MATTQLFEIDGGDELVANIKLIEAALLAAATVGLTENAEITNRLMRALCPAETGQLRKTIKFEFRRGGTPKTRIRRGGALGKTTVVGDITAGDNSTLVQSKRRGRQWQLARLQEFGTQKMPAHPFFYPSWRATKKQVRAGIAKELRKAFKAARVTPPARTAA